MTTMTTLVSEIASFGVGQVTLRNSPLVPRYQWVRKFAFFTFLFLLSGIFLS
jgi:hypothetical protein